MLLPQERIDALRAGHRVIKSFSYQPQPLARGYTSQALRIDLGGPSMAVRPVDDRMKELWTGGKGFDLWLMLKEIKASTTWDSPENPLCFSAGPLGGAAMFPGSGKTLITGISPLTSSIIDCNVGGDLGPRLKASGFDALTIVGKLTEDCVLVIDGTRGLVTIEAAPHESFDSHVIAESFTQLYASNDDDLRNVTVVSAGQAARHCRMGMLNVSFFDWRRGVPRFKQAGRGGLGHVLHDKHLKAIVVKSPEVTPLWQVSPSKAASFFPCCQGERSDKGAIEAIIAKWAADPEHVIEMLQDVQDAERYISPLALDRITKKTGVSKARLYHIVTFYKDFSLLPQGKRVIEVCTGTACHVKGAPRLIEAFEQELGVRLGETTKDKAFSLSEAACLGCCSLAPAVRIGDQVHGNLTSKQVAKLLKEVAR